MDFDRLREKGPGQPVFRGFVEEKSDDYWSSRAFVRKLESSTRFKRNFSSTFGDFGPVLVEFSVRRFGRVVIRSQIHISD